MADTTQRAMQWIVSGDTGASSETIWAVMQMVKPRYADTPADPDDFGRCYRLLHLIQEWRDSLKLVAYEYPEWAPLVREWDALTKLYEHGKYTVMCERMRQLNDEGLLLCGWTLTAPGCGSGPARGYKVPREAIEKALSADAVAGSVE